MMRTERMIWSNAKKWLTAEEASCKPQWFLLTSNFIHPTNNISSQFINGTQFHSDHSVNEWKPLQVILSIGINQPLIIFPIWDPNRMIKCLENKGKKWKGFCVDKACLVNVINAFGQLFLKWGGINTIKTHSRDKLKQYTQWMKRSRSLLHRDTTVFICFVYVASLMGISFSILWICECSGKTSSMCKVQKEHASFFQEDLYVECHSYGTGYTNSLAWLEFAACYQIWVLSENFPPDPLGISTTEWRIWFSNLSLRVCLCMCLHAWRQHQLSFLRCPLWYFFFWDKVSYWSESHGFS